MAGLVSRAAQLARRIVWEFVTAVVPAVAISAVVWLPVPLFPTVRSRRLASPVSTNVAWVGGKVSLLAGCGARSRGPHIIRPQGKRTQAHGLLSRSAARPLRDPRLGRGGGDGRRLPRTRPSPGP